jgi:thiol:disulfide interchange protein
MKRNQIVLLIFIVILVIIGLAYSQTRKNTSMFSNSSIDTKESSVSSGDELSGQNYKDYSKADFDSALSNGKVVLLYFTANWCPICKDQEPVNLEAYSTLSDDESIEVFEVNILDNETTREDEEIADEYNVTYQHTFIVIDSSGEVSFRYTGPLTKEDIVENVQDAKN